MQSILDGDYPGRLVALIDGAAEREGRWQAARDNRTPPEMPKPWARRPSEPKPEFRKPYAWKRTERRQWATLTASQRALAASAGVDSKHGGDRWGYWLTTVDEQARAFDCSRRLVLMAKKLRATGSRALLRAVASGTIGLGDALAHTDRPVDDLRKAIRMVERRNARSLRQALNST